VLARDDEIRQRVALSQRAGSRRQGYARLRGSMAPRRRGPTVTPRMHVDELDIDEALVRRLLAEQFPGWARLPLHRVGPSGTDNAIFRLGEELAVRIPRRHGSTTPGSKELEWLPKLAPIVPVQIPVPVAQGRPGAGYPWHWEIHTWVDGETVPVEEIDALQAALDLAAIVRTLQQIDPAGAPDGRGNPLAERDAEMQAWLAEHDGDAAAAGEWQREQAAPAWDGPPVWDHGDLDMRNWLVGDGRITGVIDWGTMGVGDPACDVMVAWKLHSAEARDAFRYALPIDD